MNMPQRIQIMRPQMPTSNEVGQNAMQQDEDAELNKRQRIMYEFFEVIAKKMGKWNQGAGANGAHYMDKHPFGDKGMKCINCSFFQGGNRCEIVEGDIAPEAICKLWVIREELIKE